MKPFLALIVILSLTLGCHAQVSASKSDSLKHILHSRTLTIEARIDLLLQIANEEIASSGYDAQVYAEQAMQLARSSGNFGALADAYLLVSEVALNEGELDSSIYFSKQAIPYYTKSNNFNKLGKAYNQLGMAYEAQGNYPEAYTQYLLALKQYEIANDTHGIGNEYLNIGLIHNYHKDYSKAEFYFNRALQIAKRDRYSDLEVAALNNLGVNYQGLKDYKKALGYFNHVLELDMKNGNKRDIAYSLNNVGVIYYENNQLSKALEYYNKSAQLKEQLNDHMGLSSTYINLADVYIKLKQYKPAELYLSKSDQLCRRYNFEANLTQTYEGYYRLYKESGNFERALHYYIKYAQNNDSLFAAEKELAIEQMQKQYDMDNANSEIALKSVQLSQEKKNTIYLFALVVLLGITCIYFIYSKRRIDRLNKRLKRHQREIEQQNEILRQKNKEIAKAKEYAEDATKAKSQFLSVMSHEIRTPLNAIIGVTNLLNETQVDAVQRRNIQILKASSDNLLALINDILDLSKIESGKMQVQRIPFCLREVVANLHELFLVNAQEKGLEFILAYDDGLTHKLLGDPLRINQILSNLISNAIKFTEVGKVEVSIALANEGPDYFDVNFKISDTGIGIPTNKLDSIFDSFEQVNSETTRKYGGTGLGLSISKQLLEVLGSKLMLKSKEGEGSVFYFTIRFAKVQAGNIDISSVDGGVALGILSGKRILIAEDNPTNIYILKQFLGKWNMQVFVASDGIEAVKTALEADIDIVLMDIHMPLMDGYEAAQKILEVKHQLPIIAITANTLSEITSKMKASGMVDCLPKPFHPNELASKLIARLV